jgi:Fic/DOC family
MSPQPIGSQWLKKHYNLTHHRITHASYIGSNVSVELTSKGNVEQIYRAKYKVAQDTPLDHLEFSLKYDDFNLEFLKAVFDRIKKNHIEIFIASAPASKYARKIGFLYEFFTGEQINLSPLTSGNYADLLDEEKYITGKPIKNTRWRINNNLLGNKDYCPVVRKTKELKELLSQNIQGKIKDLKKSYSADMFSRAINYLYTKETKSSYEIERENPSADRMEKFVALLVKAGTEPIEEIMATGRLIQLQNAIVDPRFAATDFRDFQNYVGESLPNFQEFIHYICPPPAILLSLMDGLRETLIKTQGTRPEVRTALIAFGFVFIHPFEDGNGRLHRFLIHDMLLHDKLVPQGLIIPVSAHLLNHIREYDQALEKYSKPLMQRIKYSKLEDGGLRITNAPEVEPYFRYPDLTDHCVYLIQAIHATITEDMPNELLFIQRYHETKKELQHIVDMPDKLINSMLTFLHQNNGVFPKRKRDYFPKLTDKEIALMQTAYRKVFELGTID